MRKVFKVLTLMYCAVFLSACSSNYLMTFNGENVKKDEDKGTFSFNNDTVQIDYSFADRDGRIYLRIENKIDKPILWDLKSSAMVINGKTQGYSAEQAAFNGKMNASVYDINASKSTIFNDSWVNGYITGSVSLPKDVVLIPPHAYVDGHYFDFKNDVKSIVRSSQKEKVYMYDMSGESFAVKLARFDGADSPYSLRSYLSYSILEDGKAIVKTTEQKFYAAQLWQTGSVALNNIIELYNKRGDVLAVKEKKGQGAMLVGGALALTAVAAAIDPKAAE
ncbi:YgdI/YgdR family lipoprotein [Sphingobacterium sp. BIGb0116]|uniref:YgdI/YgdR family lipoprotein n=1 Tax=Sphingobacterium sp. BIGb0116 TaxID=2940619 RepID=UPI0021679504|nr:YgdI/YgdR family lipoprotein [Sphingobacterium sp. BIGb0116]MCS4164100.1 hypothetical protein [Sphingobacterium sp. BIGb0116]